MATQTVSDIQRSDEEAEKWPRSLPDQTGLQESIHAPHRDERNRIILALEASTMPKIRNQAFRMASCADSLFLFFSPTQGTVRENVHRCKSRLCPYCSRARTGHVAKQMQDLVEDWPDKKHLVLTVKSSDKPLRSQLRDLIQWFAKLRRTKFWKAKVVRGVYTLEVTVNPRTGLWHPHLHCIISSQYLPHKQLQYAWHKITGGSDVVWIEAVNNTYSMVMELCKYLGKPSKSYLWTDNQIRHYAAGIHGMRMLQAFGPRQAKPIKDEIEIFEPAADEDHISLAKLLWMVDRNSTPAAQCVYLLAELFPHVGRYIYQRMPQFDPGDDARRHKAAAVLNLGRTKPPPKPPPPSLEAKRAAAAALACQLADLIRYTKDD